jgi:2-polyprenyl-6-methoxyphenol hydroxylase-like FAD-dependent oxidoreductase
MTHTDRHVDVVVIGAGPAGLFAALAISPHLRVVVVDRRDRPGGAGGATDGKLNLSPHIGLDLAELSLWRRRTPRPASTRWTGSFSTTARTRRCTAWTTGASGGG